MCWSSDDGKLLAVRSAEGGLLFSSKSAGRSTREAWLRRSALSSAEGFWPQRGEVAGGQLRCDALGCIYRGHGRIVALARVADALLEDCRLADVVISRVPVTGPCPSARTVVDRADLAQRGAHALWLDSDEVRVETTDGVRGHRPWVLRRGVKRDDDDDDGSAASDDPGVDGAEPDASPQDAAPGGR